MKSIKPDNFRQSTRARKTHDEANTQARQAAFVEAVLQVGTITGAAKLAGVDRTTHYIWLKDPLYEKAYRDALEQFADRIRHEVARRALQGVKRDVYYKGVIVGQETEYSDRMLELLAKAKCAEFQDKVDVTGRLTLEQLLSKSYE